LRTIVLIRTNPSYVAKVSATSKNN